MDIHTYTHTHTHTHIYIYQEYSHDVDVDVPSGGNIVDVVVLMGDSFDFEMRIDYHEDCALDENVDMIFRRGRH